jgi:membrane associated rhomboid family serine protease
VSHSSPGHFLANMTALCGCLVVASASPCSAMVTYHWIGPVGVYLVCGAMGSVVSQRVDQEEQVLNTLVVDGFGCKVNRANTANTTDEENKSNYKNKYNNDKNNMDWKAFKRTPEPTLGASGAVAGLAGMLLTDGSLFSLIGATNTTDADQISGVVWAMVFGRLVMLSYRSSCEGGHETNDVATSRVRADDNAVICLDHRAHIGGWAGGAVFGILNRILVWTL